MSIDNRVIRTAGKPSYGVTITYSNDGKLCVAKSHYPSDVLVNTECLHYGTFHPETASPIENEFIEYWSAMQCTVDKIDQQIAELQLRRAELTSHMENSMMIGGVYDGTVTDNN